MAASTRALTPTHSGPFSAPNRPNTPSRNSTGATFGTHLTKSPRNLSPRLSPQPLASADDRRPHTQELPRHVSPNPAAAAAAAAVQSILGGSNSPSLNRSKDGLPDPTEMSAPLEKVAKSIIIPSQVTGENMQTSPVSLSSFGSTDLTSAPTVTASDATAGPLSLPGQGHEGAAPPQPQQQQQQQQQSSHHHHHHHHQPIAPNPGDHPSNRAMTFPGPLADYDPRAPQRQMSLPGYAQNDHKSPSTKRHKCPYCSTDFTRHHNLKSHLLTHSQEKPYECTTCQARFRRLHDLKRHTKLHTGERPHTCPKCGRRFARGDALARHNKGQGGCAGRRSSFGIDEDMIDGKGEDGMDGVMYHGDPDAEAEDDEDGDGRRRVSEPARKRQNTGNSTQGSYRQHSSTYPPIAALNNQAAMGHNNLRPLYPPGSTQTTNISPKLAPSSLSSVHYSAAQPNMFAQGGMTESPKPLSPGQAEHRRLGAPEGSSVGPPPRSPSMSQQLHQNLSRGLGRGSSPTVLAPPPQAGAPHLPSLPGLNPNIAKQGSQGGRGNGPSMLNQQIPSQPGSMSSHGTNSVGSMREAADPKNVWNYVRELENKMASMNQDYEQKMATMAEEMATLRAQLAQQHQAPGPQVQPQGH
ncbi:hypothetical protein B0J11DRAFT_210542 [Dendryphion nanum]|uniref:C2H2-type domain-containing protein n=1 Tax=Dendryphion nanum TaxID=256645 RepID=A0A9P9E3Y7_9PLEO|nr:hypothetical protein B0J11DRAFT_210542 [Dendryphion nanum]